MALFVQTFANFETAKKAVEEFCQKGSHSIRVFSMETVQFHNAQVGRNSDKITALHDDDIFSCRWVCASHDYVSPSEKVKGTGCQFLVLVQYNNELKSYTLPTLNLVHNHEKASVEIPWTKRINISRAVKQEVEPIGAALDGEHDKDEVVDIGKKLSVGCKRKHSGEMIPDPIINKVSMKVDRVNDKVSFKDQSGVQPIAAIKSSGVPTKSSSVPNITLRPVVTTIPRSLINASQRSIIPSSLQTRTTVSCERKNLSKELAERNVKASTLHILQTPSTSSKVRIVSPHCEERKTASLESVIRGTKFGADFSVRQTVSSKINSEYGFQSKTTRRIAPKIASTVDAADEITCKLMKPIMAKTSISSKTTSQSSSVTQISLPRVTTSTGELKSKPSMVNLLLKRYKTRAAVRSAAAAAHASTTVSCAPVSNRKIASVISSAAGTGSRTEQITPRPTIPSCEFTKHGMSDTAVVTLSQTAQRSAGYVARQSSGINDNLLAASQPARTFSKSVLPCPNIAPRPPSSNAPITVILPVPLGHATHIVPRPTILNSSTNLIVIPVTQGQNVPNLAFQTVNSNTCHGRHTSNIKPAMSQLTAVIVNSSQPQVSNLTVAASAAGIAKTKTMPKLVAQSSSTTACHRTVISGTYTISHTPHRTSIAPISVATALSSSASSGSILRKVLHESSSLALTKDCQVPRIANNDLSTNTVLSEDRVSSNALSLKLRIPPINESVTSRLAARLVRKSLVTKSVTDVNISGPSTISLLNTVKISMSSTVSQYNAISAVLASAAVSQSTSAVKVNTFAAIQSGTTDKLILPASSQSATSVKVSSTASMSVPETSPKLNPLKCSTPITNVNTTTPSAPQLKPVAACLNELGLSLVREYVYSVLIELEGEKYRSKPMTPVEQKQLDRLVTARCQLSGKLTPFHTRLLRCICGFTTESKNVLSLHHQYGAAISSRTVRCCRCDNFKTTSYFAFMLHMRKAHNMAAKWVDRTSYYQCSMCNYEHQQYSVVHKHMAECASSFCTNSGLTPTTSECDIIARPTPRPMAVVAKPTDNGFSAHSVMPQSLRTPTVVVLNSFSGSTSIYGHPLTKSLPQSHSPRFATGKYVPIQPQVAPLNLPLGQGQNYQFSTPSQVRAVGGQAINVGSRTNVPVNCIAGQNYGQVANVERHIPAPAISLSSITRSQFNIQMGGQHQIQGSVEGSGYQPAPSCNGLGQESLAANLNSNGFTAGQTYLVEMNGQTYTIVIPNDSMLVGNAASGTAPVSSALDGSTDQCSQTEVTSVSLLPSSVASKVKSFTPINGSSTVAAVKCAIPRTPEVSKTGVLLAHGIKQKVLRESQTGNQPTDPSLSANLLPVDDVDMDAAEHVCEMCGALLQDLSSLWIHFSLSHGICKSEIGVWKRSGPRRRCTSCKLFFYTKEGLAKHQAQLHDSKQSGKYPCSFCGKYISDAVKHLLSKHYPEIDTMLLTMNCLICNISHDAYGEFEQHMISMHGNAFNEICRLQISKTAISKKKTAGCILSSPRSAACEHDATGYTHATEIWHKPETMCRRSTGVVRSRKHWWYCTQCQKNIICRAGILNHLWLVHSFPCSLCGRVWISAVARQRHFYSIHAGEKEQCMVCGRLVDVGLPYVQHIKEEHLKDCSIKLDRVDYELSQTITLDGNKKLKFSPVKLKAIPVRVKLLSKQKYVRKLEVVGECFGNEVSGIDHGLGSYADKVSLSRINEKLPNVVSFSGSGHIDSTLSCSDESDADLDSEAYGRKKIHSCGRGSLSGIDETLNCSGDSELIGSESRVNGDEDCGSHDWLNKARSGAGKAKQTRNSSRLNGRASENRIVDLASTVTISGHAEFDGCLYYDVHDDNDCDNAELGEFVQPNRDSLIISDTKNCPL